MRAVDAIRRSGIAISPDRSIEAAAAVMEHAGVGCLAVIEWTELVGIVTDRDLVRRGIARALPLDTRVDAVMSSPVVTIDAYADAHDAFAIFRGHSIRRVAVTDGGRFMGVLSVDDLLVDLAQDLFDLAAPVHLEITAPQREERKRPAVA